MTTASHRPPPITKPENILLSCYNDLCFCTEQRNDFTFLIQTITHTEMEKEREPMTNTEYQLPCTGWHCWEAWDLMYCRYYPVQESCSQWDSPTLSTAAARSNNNNMYANDRPDGWKTFLERQPQQQRRRRRDNMQAQYANWSVESSLVSIVSYRKARQSAAVVRENCSTRPSMAKMNAKVNKTRREGGVKWE